MQELTLNEKIKQILLDKDIIDDNDTHYLCSIIGDDICDVIKLKKDIKFKFMSQSLLNIIIYRLFCVQKTDIDDKYFPFSFHLALKSDFSSEFLCFELTISKNFELFINDELYSQEVLNDILIDYLISLDKVHINDVGISNIINLFYFPKQHAEIPFYSILTNKDLLKDFVYKFLTYEHAENINNIGNNFYTIDPSKKINDIQKDDIHISKYFDNPIENIFKHIFITQLEILIPALKYNTSYNDRCCTYHVKSDIPENIRKHLFISIQTKYESNNNIPYIKLSTNGGYSKELRLNEDPFDFIDNCLFDIKEIYANWYKLYSDDYYCSRLEFIVKNQLKEKNFHITKLNDFSIVFSHNKDWFGDIFFNLSYQNFIIGANINFEEFNSNSDNIIEYLTIGMNNFELANIIEHSNNKITNNNKTRL